MGHFVGNKKYGIEEKKWSGKHLRRSFGQYRIYSIAAMEKLVIFA